MDISYDDAYDTINNYSVDTLVNNSSEKWKIYDNYDAVQNLLNEDNLIKYYGKVYTIEDAIKTANENEQNFFVWYNNSYELDNFASKLYFIDIYSIDEDIYNKTNWVKHENVTTCILKYDFENFTDDTSLNENTEYQELLKLLEEQKNVNKELQKNYIDTIQKVDFKNLNYSIIKDLNDKITTYGQAISMNNYETNINNKILITLSVIIFVVIGIFIIVITYYNAKSAGKIKLLGK